jgi:hypothetical protein
MTLPVVVPISALSDGEVVYDASGFSHAASASAATARMAIENSSRGTRQRWV